MNQQITDKLLKLYNQEPHRVHKLLLQIDPGGDLLDAVADAAREQRDNAPLVKPQGEIVTREGWEI